jgi:hypothetical protein
MAFWSKRLHGKYPDAQVPDPMGADDTFWVDGAVVYDHLVEEGKTWDGEGEVDRFALWCEDRHDANLVKVKGQGWLACSRQQARELMATINDD